MKATNLMPTVLKLSLCPICDKATFVKSQIVKIRPLGESAIDVLTIYCKECDYEVSLLQDATDVLRTL